MIDVGQRVGDYELVGRLGAGGMATLYVARREGAAGFARHLAIKVVHPHLAKDERFVRMLVDEAKLCARIEHPNVVHVEELGEVDGSYFIAMEYVHGCSLADLLAALSRTGRRLSLKLAVWIAMEVAAGLDAAHELKGADGAPLGLVHRDVSPQNVLLAYKGHVKLIDFGVAKARGRLSETNAGSIKGKLSYMSPEHANGAPLDRRADIYALGICLWEALAMRRLFPAADDLEAFDKVRNPRVVPPSRYCEDISLELEAVVLQALSPKPEHRPGTARAFRRMLMDACPEAIRVDARDVAQLLQVVMADHIRAHQQKMPEAVSDVVEVERDLAQAPGSQEKALMLDDLTARVSTVEIPISERLHALPDIEAELEDALTFRGPVPTLGSEPIDDLADLSIFADEPDDPAPLASEPPPRPGPKVLPRDESTSLTRSSAFRARLRPGWVPMAVGVAVVGLLVGTLAGIVLRPESDEPEPAPPVAAPPVEVVRSDPGPEPEVPAAPAPVDDPADGPADAPIDDPVDGPVDDPAAAPADAPVDGPGAAIEAPGLRSRDEPVGITASAMQRPAPPPPTARAEPTAMQATTRPRPRPRPAPAAMEAAMEDPSPAPTPMGDPPLLDDIDW